MEIGCKMTELVAFVLRTLVMGHPVDLYEQLFWRQVSTLSWRLDLLWFHPEMLQIFWREEETCWCIKTLFRRNGIFGFIFFFINQNELGNYWLNCIWLGRLCRGWKWRNKSFSVSHVQGETMDCWGEVSRQWQGLENQWLQANDLQRLALWWTKWRWTMFREELSSEHSWNMEWCSLSLQLCLCLSTGCCAQCGLWNKLSSLCRPK